MGQWFQAEIAAGPAGKMLIMSTYAEGTVSLLGRAGLNSGVDVGYCGLCDPGNQALGITLE
jgi:hypothetical protein